MVRTSEKERIFEKKHILSQRDRYLDTDVVTRYERDPGYRAKIDLIEEQFRGTQGWILDVGANTCGESEFLVTRDLSVIALEINEFALDISRQRAEKFRRHGPKYLAGDGQHIPLADASVKGILCFETLHHMQDPERAASEMYRTLAPGGFAFFYEPYGANPYRRLSEVRDFFKGTIEKSFTVRSLRTVLAGVGFEIVRFERRVLPPSEWKKEVVSSKRRLLKDAYYTVSKRLPKIFASLAVTVRKPGNAEVEQASSFESLLRCPVSHAPLVANSQRLVSTDENTRLSYPIYNGIPVLIAEDATQLPYEVWKQSTRA